jgi:tetratricopeptide (TPR) repeat protein
VKTFLKKHELNIELGAILVLQLLLVGSFVTDIYATVPWFAVGVTMAALWLLPGYILWRLTGKENLPGWFYWLPVTFGLGLAWLMIPVVIVFFFELNMPLLVRIALASNSLLVFLYIFLRFTGRLQWSSRNQNGAGEPPVNWWMVAGAIITLLVILYLFLETLGLRFDNDVTRLLGQVRGVLIAPRFKFTQAGISLWNYITALMVRVAGTNLLDTYTLYLSVLMIIVAAFNQLVLAHTLFQNKNKAYFALIIFGVYFISDIDLSSKATGIGLFFRLMEDKYVAWLLLLPLAQSFFLRSLQTADNRYLPLFGLISLTAVLIHPIAITWLILSIGGVWLLHLLFQRNRRMLYAGAFVIIMLALLLIPFGYWVAIPGLERGANLPSLDPLNALRSLSFQRVLVLSAAQNRYMAHPLLLSHPMVMAAIALCLVLLFQLKRSLAAQFLFSNIAVVLLLLFNPITAPLIGDFVLYWQIYRIVWMLPVSLTLAYILYDVPAYAAGWLKYRAGKSRIIDFFIGLAPLLIVLVMVALLETHLVLSVRSLHAWNNTVTGTTAERGLAAFLTDPGLPENSTALISRDYSWSYSRLPLRVPEINFISTDRFSQIEVIDKASLEYLQKNQADYLIINRHDALDGYLPLLPDLFFRLFRNNEYSVYVRAVETAPSIETKLLEANQEFNQKKFDNARNLFQEILARQPDYPPAVVGLGLTLSAMGNRDLAIPLFRQAIPVYPDEPLLQLKLAGAMQDSLDVNWEETFALYQGAMDLTPEAGWVYRGAVADFEQVPANIKNTPAAMALAERLTAFFQSYAAAEPYDYARQQQLAEVYRQLGDTEAEMAQYDRMKTLFPGDMTPYVTQANLYLDRGNPAEAEQVYLEALDRQPQPEVGWMYDNLIDIYRQQQDYESALVFARRMAEVVSLPIDLGNSNLQLARIYQGMGQPEQAEPYYLQALETMAYYAPAQAEIGEFYEGQGNLDEAISHYRQAAELQPGDGGYPYLLGAALQKTGQLTESLDFLRQAYKLNSRSDKICQLLGETLLATGEAKEAVGYLKRAIVLNPDNDDRPLLPLQQALVQNGSQAELVRYWNDTGYAYLFSDPAMVPMLKRAIDERKLKRETFLGLLARQVIRDQSPTMEAVLQAMVQVSPFDADLHFYLAEMYRYRGDFALAKESYGIALKFDPALAPVYLKSGELAEAAALEAEPSFHQQYLKEALDWYQQYQELKPVDPLGLKKQWGVLLALNDHQATIVHQQLIKQLSQAGPQTTVNQTMDNGWTFAGYSGDETMLVQGVPTALWLFWQGPPGSPAGDEAGGWYALGENRWVQFVDDAASLLINGNFESGLRQGSPAGFPSDIYNAPPTTRQLKVTGRSGLQSTVAMLDNELATRTSFASSVVEVDESALYLQAGWVSSPEGNAFLGRRWFGASLPDVPVYDFVVSEVHQTEWTHYAGVAVPPPGATQAEIWLLNTKTRGQAFFDEVLFLKITSPGKVKQE